MKRLEKKQLEKSEDDADQRCPKEESEHFHEFLPKLAGNEGPDMEHASNIPERLIRCQERERLGPDRRGKSLHFHIVKSASKKCKKGVDKHDSLGYNAKAVAESRLQVRFEEIQKTS